MYFDKLPLKVAQFSWRFPKSVLFAAVCMTILALLLAVRLELHNDVLELLPKDMPSIQTIQKILKETDGLGYQAIIVRSPNKLKNRAFLDSLQKRLASLYFESGENAGIQGEKIQQRLHRVLRDIFLHARNPSAVKKSLLIQKIESFDKNPFVDYSMTGYPRDFFMKRALLFLKKDELELIHKKLSKKIKFDMRQNQPGYVDLLGEEDPGFKLTEINEKYKHKALLKRLPKRFEVEQDGMSYAAILIRPLGSATDLTFAINFMKELRACIAVIDPSSFEPKMKLQYVGAFSYNQGEFEAVSTDIRNSLLVTLFLLGILLFVFFRKVHVFYLIPLPLLMGTVWSFGFAYLAIGYLTTATGFIGALILGLGIDYGIYLFDRYLQERTAGETVLVSLERSYLWTGKAVSTAALTTAGAFFALLVCDFTGFSQFGLIAGGGVLFCLLAMHTVLPALIILSERRSELTIAKPFFRFPERFKGRSFPLAMPLILLAFLMMGGSFFFIPQVGFESNFKKIGFQEIGPGDQKDPWKKFEKFFSESLLRPIVFLVEDEHNVKKLTQEIKRRAAAYVAKTGDKGLIKEIVSYQRLVPEQQEQKLEVIRKMRKLLMKNNITELIEDDKKQKMFDKYKKLLDVKAFTVNDLPRYIQRDLILYKKNSIEKRLGYMVVVQSRSFVDGEDARKIIEMLSGIRFDNKSFEPSGEPIVVGELTRVVKRDSYLAIGASLLALFLLVFLDLRSLKLTLFSLWPLLTGLLTISVLLVVADVKLNIFNMMVLPALLGIGIDGGVHMLHRYRERPELGVLGVQSELTLPILVASLSTLFSFASMLTASHTGVRSIGWVASFGLITCLFGALVLLPALMQKIFQHFPLRQSLSAEYYPDAVVIPPSNVEKIQEIPITSAGALIKESEHGERKASKLPK